MAKKKENIIYSRLEYDNALRIKKNILKIEADLLETMQAMEEYKLLRKKEYMSKVKLKNTLKETKASIGKLLDTVPKTPGIKKMKKENIEKQKFVEEKHDFSIEAQLKDIRKRLQELS